MFETGRKWTPANRRLLVGGLTLTICVQMFVLATEYVSSVWPLWFGTPVVLKTAPVDPRSLFRGNYVRLSYDISRIATSLTQDRFKKGEVGYVTLKEVEGVFVPAGLYRQKPDGGTFIRGRVTGIGYTVNLKYGIEAFFMPKQKAEDTARAIRQGASAEVYLSSTGRAAVAKLNIGSGDT